MLSFNVKWMDDFSHDKTMVTLEIRLKPSSTDPLSPSVDLSLRQAIESGVNNLREFAKKQQAPGDCAWTRRYGRNEPWEDFNYTFD
eukprot:1978053-Prymnesium_polylepis.1